MSSESLALPAIAGLPAKVVIPVVAGLGVLALLFLVSAVVVGIVIYRRKKAAAPAPVAQGLPGVLPGLLGKASVVAGSPMVHELEKVIVGAIQQSHHAAMHALVGKMFPALVPFLPLIDKGADLVEGAVAKKVGVPALPAPTAAPSAPSPMDRLKEAEPLLHDALQAIADRLHRAA